MLYLLKFLILGQRISFQSVTFMNSFIRLLANVFFAFIISFVFADFAYFGFNFVKSSPINASICMFIGCFISSLLVCEMFSISKESNKTNRRVKRTRLTRIAKKIAQEKALAYAEKITQDQDNEEIAINSVNNIQSNLVTQNNNEVHNNTNNDLLECKSISSKNNNKILIKNLPYNVSKTEIISLFTNEFIVKNVEISRNKNGNKKQKLYGSAVATVILDNSNFEKAILKINGKKIKNQTIVASLIN